MATFGTMKKRTSTAKADNPSQNITAGSTVEHYEQVRAFMTTTPEQTQQAIEYIMGLAMTVSNSPSARQPYALKEGKTTTKYALKVSLKLSDAGDVFKNKPHYWKADKDGNPTAEEVKRADATTTTTGKDGKKTTTLNKGYVMTYTTERATVSAYVPDITAHVWKCKDGKKTPEWVALTPAQVSANSRLAFMVLNAQKRAETIAIGQLKDRDTYKARIIHELTDSGALNDRTRDTLTEALKSSKLNVRALLEQKTPALLKE